MIKGKVISGDFGRVIVRQKSDSVIELGELLIAEAGNEKILLQAFDLIYGSQLSQQNLELVSGLKLEEENDLDLFDSNLRNYTLASLKPMISINGNNAKLCKILPEFFSSVREVEKEDLKFLTKPKNSLYFGKLRSGSKAIDLDISLDGEMVLSHHILISGTTGRGKSVLMSNLLWSCIDSDYCGMLVLDPHDEYYGRNKLGLKDHNKTEKVVYYTSNNPPVGCRTLKINIKSIKPHHFNGIIDFSDPQKQALNVYYKEFGSDWIKSILLEIGIEKVEFKSDTLAVVKRQLLNILDLAFQNNELVCRGVFDFYSGESTIKDICSELEQSKTVIIDTSNISGPAELLIGSISTAEIFGRYKHYKMDGVLNSKPVVSIVLEEAPRVLGTDVLEKGSNIFETIAREGRKFKVGLTAITQLPSLIPRRILANMNTKVILGIEMKAERQAIIESASQDLSEDERNIASLDKGEAIVSSNFSKFAIPIKIPFFDEVVKQQKKETYKQDFSGVI